MEWLWYEYTETELNSIANSEHRFGSKVIHLMLHSLPVSLPVKRSLIGEHRDGKRRRGVWATAEAWGVIGEWGLMPTSDRERCKMKRKRGWVWRPKEHQFLNADQFLPAQHSPLPARPPFPAHVPIQLARNFTILTNDSALTASIRKWNSNFKCL